MTSPFQKGGDPIAAILIRIGEIERSLREAVSGPFRIPVLAEDPDEKDPTNFWLLPDGRLRSRHRNTADTAWVYREWVTSAPGSGSSGTAPAPPVPAPVTTQTTFSATYTQSYRESGAARTDNGATHLYYGSSGADSFNGRNQSLVGFDHAAIASALSGSTINNVWLDLTNVHSWYNSGVYIHFGIHNFSSEPSSWAGGGIPRRMIVNHHFGKPQRRTVPMPLEFAQAFRDGWGKGIALEAPSSSREFYGYAAGVGSGQSLPALIINYTK